MGLKELREWTIWACETESVTDPAKALEAAMKAGGERYGSDKTSQVHDLLREKNIISGEVIENGRADGCAWVGQKDWVYRTCFPAPDGKGPHFLHCAGLDTVCDLFLNGRYIGSSRSMYLPFRRDITGHIQAQNELLIYFHQHIKVLDYYQKTMPEEWKGNVPAEALLRRKHDYGHRPKDRHGYKPIGIFDRVYIDSPEGAELLNTDIEVTLNASLDDALVVITPEGNCYDPAALQVSLLIAEADGSNPIRVQTELVPKGVSWKTKFAVHVKNPRLWWPKNYGDQPLYRASVEVSAGGKPAAKWSRPFGIRGLRKTGNMLFEFNKVPVRFWGGNFAPIWGPSNTFNPEYTFELIHKIDLAGVNAVRVWGPNQPYPDEFYDKFDELGIMVWQDFPTGGSQLPDSEEYRELFRAEASFMVKKLKHHPSIYLWCGGNENIYMCELRGEKETRGFDILTNDFRDVCAELDPQRYYHPTCPYEGRYANDPMTGDSHGSRALRAYCAGEPYGAFFSENIRVYPPQYKSFYRWIGDAIWEEGYTDIKPYGCLKAMPASWQKLVGNNGEEKFGPIWDYYAATNVDELIYKYTAAAGQDLYQMYARSRRGNPSYKNHEGQFCRGHVIWKINDPWPNFYCALVDYYLEPSLPYYAIKRAIRPVWIDFEVADHIYLWGVNDTREGVTGNLEITLYNLEFEEVRKTITLPVSLLPGSSRIITSLDFLGFLHWFTLLHAQLRDSEGNVLLTCNNYLTKENMLPFHGAQLKMERDGDFLVLTTDKFARCVELSAGEDGRAFGWVFEDNFFDLFPFETKRLQIQKRGEGACILARARYSKHTARVDL
jgi:beta-galactosidase/beta-glucuronidase